MPDRPARRDAPRRRRRSRSRRCRSGGRGRGSSRSGRNARRPSERTRWPRDAAEPGERRRMAVDHGDDAAMGRHVGEAAARYGERACASAALAGALGRGPAGVEPVGRGDREQADIAAVLGHQPDRLDRLRRDRAGIGDDDLAVRPGLAQPVAAVDDLLARAPASSAARAARSAGSRAADRPSRRSRRAAKCAPTCLCGTASPSFWM